MNTSIFEIVQIFLSCLHATLFIAQLPWKGSGTAKELLFALANLSIAIIVSSSAFFYLFVAANLVAISISAGGIWLRRDKNASCECFGVLSDELGKRSNTIGIVIIAANLLALASSAALSGAGERPLPTIAPHISGGVLLFLLAFVWARVHQPRTSPGRQAVRAGPLAPFNPNEAVRIALPADMVLGYDQQNTPRTLASIRTANLPFAFLIVADGCQPCEELKREIAVLRNFVHIPICLIAGAPGPAMEPNFLHDHDQKLRQLASVAGRPCLLMMDAGDAAITRKAYGAEFIRSALMELIGKSQPRTDAAGQAVPDLIESVS